MICMRRKLINIHLHISIYILFLSYWFTLDVYICLILFNIIFSIMRYWHEIWVQYKHLLLFLSIYYNGYAELSFGDAVTQEITYCIIIIAYLYIIPILLIILVFSYFDEKELVVTILNLTILYHIITNIDQ